MQFGKKYRLLKTNEFTQQLGNNRLGHSGETANTPTAVAKYGTIKYTYSNTMQNGKLRHAKRVPTNAGRYHAKATVEETADYWDSKAMQLEFTTYRRKP